MEYEGFRVGREEDGGRKVDGLDVRLGGGGKF